VSVHEGTPDVVTGLDDANAVAPADPGGPEVGKAAGVAARNCLDVETEPDAWEGGDASL